VRSLYEVLHQDPHVMLPGHGLTKDIANTTARSLYGV